MTIGSSRSQKDAARIVPKGHEMLAQVSVGLAAKRLEIIARGFSPGLAEPTSALKAPLQKDAAKDYSRKDQDPRSHLPDLQAEE
jgi:hypothetical protein